MAPTSKLHVVGTTDLVGNTTVTGTLDAGSTNISGSTSFSGSFDMKRIAIGIASATQSFDLSKANYFTATITGSVPSQFTFDNPPSTGYATGFILELTDGGTTTVSWPTEVKWPSATAPTLTSGSVDVLTFVSSDSGTTWRGVASMIDSK